MCGCSYVYYLYVYVLLYTYIYLYLSLSHLALLGSARAFNKEGGRKERKSENEEGERERERAQGICYVCVCARTWYVCVREREREREREKGLFYVGALPQLSSNFLSFFSPDRKIKKRMFAKSFLYLEERHVQAFSCIYRLLYGTI